VEDLQRRLVNGEIFYRVPEAGNPGCHPEPIRWLRRHSNYLTPEKGLLTADTWVAIATWLRNTLLNFPAYVPCASSSFAHISLDHSEERPGRCRDGWAVFCLSLSAFYFLGKNLWRFRDEPGGNKIFDQGAVQAWIVLPLLA